MKKIFVVFCILISIISCKKENVVKAYLPQPKAYMVVAVKDDSTKVFSGVYVITDIKTFEGDFLINSNDPNQYFFESLYVSRNFDNTQNYIIWEINSKNKVSYFQVMASIDGINFFALPQQRTSLFADFDNGINKYTYIYNLSN